MARDRSQRTPTDAEQAADPSGSPGAEPPEPAGGDDVDLAAAAALARALRNARDRGLRPGSRAPRKRGRSPASQRGAGRDPGLLGEQLERLIVDRGWDVDVAAGAVVGRWPSIVGTDVAAHATPLSFIDGELVVQADSTAWATNLRYMLSTLLGRIEAAVGPDVVRQIRVVGPGAPSWVRGRRRVQGPGPRDTYG